MYVKELQALAVSALDHFTRSAFLEEMRCIFTVNDTSLKLDKLANGTMHPVAKDTIPYYNQLIDQAIRQIIPGL